MHDAPYRRIPLRTRGGTVRAVAVVDDVDYDWLNQWRWSLHGGGYAQRGIQLHGKRVAILMHRLILGLDAGDPRQGDHINRDRLDNRRCNLRVVTGAQNAQNVTAKGSTSSHRGVFRRDYGTWLAGAAVQGMRVRLGEFASELDAAAVAAQWRHANMPNTVEDPVLLAHEVPAASRRIAVRLVPRAAEIQERWAAGESMTEIARALGITRNSLGSLMTRLRASGVDLPYRAPANGRYHR